MQYIPYLHEAGMEVQVSSLFDAKYLAGMYRGAQSPTSVASYYLKRLMGLQGSKKPDLIWLEKEAFPWLPWFIEQRVIPRNVPLVSDYDDAIFHRYDQHTRKLVRRLLGSKISAVMSHSNIVTAGNHYLAEYAQQAGAKRVMIVPTVVDVKAYKLRTSVDHNVKARIGWIGTPQTWRTFGQPIFDLVRQTARESKAVFRAVGAGHGYSTTDEVEFFDWSEAREVSLIQGMDIGIMPLDNTPWARGKCGYKLIQYMACGLPVVASPVGANNDIVEHGVNGFFASNDLEWKHALGALLRDPELRYRMGQAGRRKVEQSYSLQVHGPRVAQILRSAARAN
ncbi:glycosyltransferase family 4 protein [Tianweitania populi]|nr:glycosyltransferase family 4 protein [Tianweitania populi]